MTLSANGAFPDWMSLLEFSFITNHPETEALISVLRIVPRGYECNESHVVYGIYVDAFLKFEPDACYPSGDFLEPKNLRDLAMFISDPSANQSEIVVQGEVMELKFSSQADGRLRLEGHLGNDGWGEITLEKQFQEYPFQKDLRFKCSLSEQSLRNTLDDLQKLLSVVDDIEAGHSPTWCET